MLDRRSLAVHQGLGADHFAAKGLADGLMAQADAEDRHVQRRGLQDGQADAGLIRGAGAGRQQYGLGLQRPGFLDGQVVVADDMRLGAQLREVVDEVVGKAVVVIDDEDHGRVLRTGGTTRQAKAGGKRTLSSPRDTGASPSEEIRLDPLRSHPRRPGPARRAGHRTTQTAAPAGGGGLCRDGGGDAGGDHGRGPRRVVRPGFHGFQSLD
ncbi:hypothetical protein D3C81_1634540 [compost metagenome]